jgi:hypothetical protein
VSDLTDQLDAIDARLAAAVPGAITITPGDVSFLLELARKQRAALDALSDWAGRNRTGFYDEAQDDAIQIIREALEAKP